MPESTLATRVWGRCSEAWPPHQRSRRRCGKRREQGQEAARRTLSPDRRSEIARRRQPPGGARRLGGVKAQGVPPLELTHENRNTQVEIAEQVGREPMRGARPALLP